VSLLRVSSTPSVKLLLFTLYFSHLVSSARNAHKKKTSLLHRLSYAYIKQIYVDYRNVDDQARSLPIASRLP